MIRKLCIGIVWFFSKILYRHKIYGKSHFPKGGGIIASNHTSYLDPPLIGISCPDEVHFLAKESLFSAPFFGGLIKRLNTHPVKQGHGNLNTLRTAMKLVMEGKKVVIFPEGKRSLDGKLHKGQLGVGLLVEKTHCYVTPVYVHAFDVWHSNRSLPRFHGRTACVFGTPMRFEAKVEAKEKKELHMMIAETIMAKIAELRDWYLAGAKGSPP